MSSPDDVKLAMEDSDAIWRSPTNRVHSVALGIALIMIGVTSMTFGAQAIVEKAAYGYVGYGIWCGFIFVCCGFLAMHYAKKPTKNNVSAAMAISMVTLLFSFGQMSLAGLGLYYNTSVSGSSGCLPFCPTSARPYCTAWTNNQYNCLSADGLVAVKFCTGALLSFGGLAFFVTTALGVTITGCMMEQKPKQVAPLPPRPQTPPGDVNPPPPGYTIKQDRVKLPPIYLSIGDATTNLTQRQEINGPPPPWEPLTQQDPRTETYSPLYIQSGIRKPPIRSDLNPLPPVEDAGDDSEI